MYETYGIDIRGVEDGSLDPSFISILVSQLPLSARVWAVIDPRASYSVDQVLLNNIEYLLRLFIYSHTEDAKFNRNQPKPVLDFKQYEKDSRFVYTSVNDMAEMMKKINGI